MMREINIKRIMTAFENFYQCRLPQIKIKYSAGNTRFDTDIEGGKYILNINNNGFTEDELIYELALISDTFNLPEISLPIYREFRAATVQFEYMIGLKKFKPINNIKNNIKVTSYYVEKLKEVRLCLSFKYRNLILDNSNNITDYILYLKLLYKYTAGCKVLEPKDNLNEFLVKDIINDSVKPLYNELLEIYINFPTDFETLSIINKKEKELILCIANEHDM